MSQISPPVRIVAVLAVAFLAIYMTVLRPKSSTPVASAPTPAATPAGNINTGKPAVTQFGKAVQAAQGAAKATEKQMQGEARSAGESTSGTGQSGSTTGRSATQSGTPTAPHSPAAASSAPAVDLTGLPRPVARAVRHHQVLALLFWNGHSSDDHAVRRAFRHVYHFDGTVYTHVAKLSSIARYGRIARGVQVAQSPTVVIVDRKLHATTLVGYNDAGTINQSVIDALRATGRLFHSRYLERINDVCTTGSHGVATVPQSESPRQLRHSLPVLNSRWDSFVKRFSAVRAPARWQALRRASVADLRVLAASNHRLLRAVRGHYRLSSLLGMFPQIRHETHIENSAQASFYRRMQKHDVVFCGKQGW